MRVLAVDIGSSSARIMTVDDRLHIEELYRQEHSAYQDEDGHYRWNIDTLFCGLRGAIDRIIETESVASIGVCSWGVDYGVIGEDGILIDMPYCYRDSRSKAHLEEMISRYGAYQLFERTGIYPDAINTIYQLLADKAEGRYDEGVQIALIADLFAYFLTGNVRAEVSNASTTQLLSTDGKDWNYQLIDELGLDRSIFPPIITTGEIYGSYRGVDIVAVGTHDTASAIYAMGDMDESTAFVSSGSWLLVGKVIDRPLVTERVFDIGYTNERVCDNKVSLLANINGLYVIQRIVAESGLSYREIDESMDSAQVLGVLDVDKLMSPDDMLGNIRTMLRVERADIMDIVKTAYYSLAVRLTGALRDLGEVTGCKISKIILTGGASKAKYFLSAVRQLMPIEIVIASGEGATLGNAMVQMRRIV